MNSGVLANLVRANLASCTPQYQLREEEGLARLDSAGGRERHGSVGAFSLEAALASIPKEFPEPDAAGAARLRELDRCLDIIEQVFPGAGSDIHLCRLVCEMLEGGWQERVQAAPAPDAGGAACGCALCRRLPAPPRRQLSDYSWRRSDGRPLTTKVWPGRPELNSVLSCGWVWARKMSDADLDLGLRFRYEDDLLVFHEYKRLVTAIDVEAITRAVTERLVSRFSTNGVRALVSGLFAAYKRSVDEYWLSRHSQGAITLRQASPFDRSTYCLLQLMDCLWWHTSPDDELWQEEHLTVLVMCRVVDDMIDTRADALTGEISNLWLTSLSAHDKAVYAACAIAIVKYGCMPESHGVLWNSWLMATTVVWLGLTGRHALWFDGVIDGVPPAADCPLCEIRPNACTGLMAAGVTLHTGPRPQVENLGRCAAELSARCDAELPRVRQLFHKELAAFEALHGEWRGNVESTWEILRRTYLAAVASCLTGGMDGRAIQNDSGVVGADLFHVLSRPPTWRADTLLLSYMFCCAHPHLMWNSQGYVPGEVCGDWLDG